MLRVLNGLLDGDTLLTAGAIVHWSDPGEVIYAAGMAWLGTISHREAVGELAQTYAAMADRPIPDVYRPSHGDAPGIIRAHSLDPELLRRTFAMSGSLHRSTLDWAERELISSVTSRTNQCFY